jgi:ribosomal protein S18 acetylase RimI-like enzyme
MQNTELRSSERIIRPYEESDEAEVIGVWHRSGLAAYPYLPTWQALPLETAAHVFRTIIRPSNKIWVGVLDGRVVAYLAMQGSYIDRLYVDPPEWHKGWGRHFIRLARELSPSELTLHTHQENYAARALYESEGFRAIKFGISPPPESAPDVEYAWRPGN